MEVFYVELLQDIITDIKCAMMAQVIYGQELYGFTKLY